MLVPVPCQPVLLHYYAGMQEKPITEMNKENDMPMTSNIFNRRLNRTFRCSLRRFTALLPLLLATLLAGCFGPETPEEVAAEFWSAVIENDADAAVDTSTLTDPARFDGFDKNWNGYQAELGKLVVEGSKAQIDTVLSKPDGSDREVITWLVQRDEEWKVDYERTQRSVRGGVFGDLFNRMTNLGRDLEESLNQSADEANRKLDKLLNELEANQEAFTRQADQALQTYSAQLQQSLKSMDESIQQTLQEQSSRLSEADIEALEDAASELEQRLESIDPDSIQSALENSKALAEIRSSLEKLDSAALEKQKKQWQELSESLTEEVEKLRKEMME